MRIISYALVTLLALHSVAHTQTETYLCSPRWAGVYSHFQADARHASRSPLRSYRAIDQSRLNSNSSGDNGKGSNGRTPAIGSFPNQLINN
jgi:hypothetical protein